VGPRGSLGAVARRKNPAPAGSLTPVVQPLALSLGGRRFSVLTAHSVKEIHVNKLREMLLKFCAREGIPPHSVAVYTLSSLLCKYVTCREYRPCVL
jgi:hypothetical protein